VGCALHVGRYTISSDQELTGLGDSDRLIKTQQSEAPAGVSAL